MAGVLTPFVHRGDINAPTTTTVQFAATTGLTVRPIKLVATSGRMASLEALPAALTISGTAGTRYVYANLAAPSGSPWSTLLGNLLNLTSWNRSELVTMFKALITGDGTNTVASLNSTVTLVETGTPTLPSPDHIALGQFECAGGLITNLTSYLSKSDITVSAFIHGQCVLERSGANLVLKAMNGQQLVIDGTARSVPVAGVTLSAAGLTPGTLYRIYARWTGSAIVLDTFTTGTTTHTNGVTILSGDSTRTYVGEAWVVSGPAWSDVVPVWSHFHPTKPRMLVAAAGNPFATIASTATETSVLSSTTKIRGGLSGNFARLTVLGDVLANTGTGRGFTLRVYLGGGIISSHGGTVGQYNNALRFPWYLSQEIALAGSATAQVTHGRFLVRVPGSPNIAGIGGPIDGTLSTLAMHSTVAVDLNVEQAFDISIQPEVSSAQLSIRVFGVYLELVPTPSAP